MNSELRRFRHIVVVVVVPLLLVVSATAAAAVKPYDYDGDGASELVMEWSYSRDRKTYHRGLMIAPVGRDNTPNVRVRRAGDMGGPIGAEGSGDFNGDGKADTVALPNYSDQLVDELVVVLGGSRVPGARAVRRVPVPIDAFRTHLRVSDLDRDGFSDVLLPDLPACGGTKAYRLRVAWGGTGGLSAERQTTIVIPSSRACGQGSRPYVAVANVDGDARRELIVGGTGGIYEEFEKRGWFKECDVSAVRAVSCKAVIGTPPLRHWDDAPGPVTPVTGDIVGSRYQDLVLPQSFEGPGGRLFVYQGTASGLKATPARVTQATGGVPGSSEAGDMFGADLAVGDVDGSGKRDLLVAAPGEDNNRGAVTVLYGSRRELGGNGGWRLSLKTHGIANTRYDYHFGWTVGLQDLRGDGTSDVIVTGLGRQRAWDPDGDGFGEPACPGTWIVPTNGKGTLLTRQSTRIGWRAVLEATRINAGSRCVDFDWGSAPN